MKRMDAARQFPSRKMDFITGLEKSEAPSFSRICFMRLDYDSRTLTF